MLYQVVAGLGTVGSQQVVTRIKQESSPRSLPENTVGRKRLSLLRLGGIPPYRKKEELLKYKKVVELLVRKGRVVVDFPGPF